MHRSFGNIGIGTAHGPVRELLPTLNFCLSHTCFTLGNLLRQLSSGKIINHLCILLIDQLLSYPVFEGRNDIWEMVLTPC